MTSQDTLREFSKFSEILSQAGKRKKSASTEETKLKVEKRLSNDMADCCVHQCQEPHQNQPSPHHQGVREAVRQLQGAAPHRDLALLWALSEGDSAGRRRDTQTLPGTRGDDGRVFQSLHCFQRKKICFSLEAI